MSGASASAEDFDYADMPSSFARVTSDYDFQFNQQRSDKHLSFDVDSRQEQISKWWRGFRKGEKGLYGVFYNRKERFLSYRFNLMDDLEGSDFDFDFDVGARQVSYGGHSQGASTKKEIVPFVGFNIQF